MTVYHVDLYQVVHTCPGFDQPHAVEITRTIVDTIEGGPCRIPHEIADGVLIACGRIRTRDRQCVACKVQIIVRNTTVDDRGYQGPQCPGLSEVTQ